ncbi:MAG: hypothetical protein ACLUZZ_04635 [Alistipes inops]
MQRQKQGDDITHKSRNPALLPHTGAAATPDGHDDRKEKRHEEPVSDKGRLKISGYLQPQFQWGEGDASLKVGTPNDNPSESFNRFGLRRGHLKFAYAYKTASAVVQIDVSTEKGVILKDAYIDVKEPWLRTFGLQAGVFNRPFGLEIELSSSVRETPERSYIFPMLFPDERDFGAMLVIRAPEDSPWHIVGLQAGIFSGNGIGQDNDNRKDFIGHLSFGDEFDDFSFRAGASYYHGFVYQGTGTVHTMTDSGFRTETDPSNKGRYAKRQYYGFDACFRFETDLGTTTLRGEYLFGTQPGTQTSSKSPNTAALPASDTYLRPFRGGYVLLAHDIEDTPFSLVAKYDVYDPNTKVSGNALGTGGTGITDALRWAIGFGATWHIMKGLKLTAYYDIVRNETSTALDGFAADLKATFTLRLQYKF